MPALGASLGDLLLQPLHGEQVRLERGFCQRKIFKIAESSLLLLIHQMSFSKCWKPVLSKPSRAVITENEFANKDEKNKQSQVPALLLVRERRKTATHCGLHGSPLSPYPAFQQLQLSLPWPHPKICQGSACSVPGVLQGWHRVSSSSAAGGTNPPWKWWKDEGGETFSTEELSKNISTIKHPQSKRHPTNLGIK